MLYVYAIAGLIVFLTLLGWTQSFRAHVRHYGFIPVIWFWLSGREHHGRNKENKRFKNKYDPHSEHYEAKARFSRAIQRSGWTLAPPLLVITLLLHTPQTLTLFIFFATMLAIEFAWRMYKAERAHDLDKKVARPLHGVLAPMVGVPLSTRPGTWIKVEKGGKNAKVQLPKNYHPTEAERTKVGQAIRENLGMSPMASVTFQLRGDDSYIEVKDLPPPPPTVSLKDIERYIEEAGQDQVVLGLGRGNELVKVSLAEDSPHLGLSIGAGGGKSQIAKLVAAQVLHNGGIVLILDIKRISHAWARDLPNVRYARTIQEIHDALVWLAYEVDRRTRVADVGMDVEGEVLANVGPRLLVIAEEMNEGSTRLRQLWTETRTKNDSKKSPAIMALEGALFMGRQIRINMLAVAQMMTALAAGSGAARENMGVRILGRYTRNNWRMLVPEYEMPFRSMRPGRVQVISHLVRECQVANLTGAEARELALSGTVTPFPVAPSGAIEGVVEGEIVTDDTDHGELEGPHLTSVNSDPVTDLVTLTEIARRLNRNRDSLKQASYRDPSFPKPWPEKRGRERLFDWDEIKRWAGRVRSGA